MLDLEQIESFYPEHLRKFRKNILREYVQYKILEAIFNSKFSNKLIFIGGTALHIVYGNKRFSEDLDFDNLGLGEKEFEKLAYFMKRRLELEGFQVEIKNSFAQAFRSRIRILNILQRMGLSRHKEEKLLVLVDMEPQKAHYSPFKIILNKFDVFTRINAAPVDALLSQKIYSIFKRKRFLGRDFYDVIFLLAKTEPDYKYLKAKLKIADSKALRKGILKICRKVNFKQISKDVEPFLFMPQEARKILIFKNYIKERIAS